MNKLSIFILEIFDTLGKRQNLQIFPLKVSFEKNLFSKTQTQSVPL